jgi:NitT/TauT family transport system substrate-binding protein
MSVNRLTRYVLVLAIPVIGISLVSCSPEGYSGPADSISIGFLPGQTAAEAYIAQDKGFFNENSLNVTIKDYDSGVAAVDGMLRGEIDLAGAAEIALVYSAFNHQPISAITVANKVESSYLVGRRDRGIENVSDLDGKQVGVSLHTIAGFYLGRFLEMHGISPDRVNLIDIDFAQTVDALVNGSIDAAATIQPYVDTINNKLGTNAISWNIQSSQVTFGIFIGKNDWIKEHPDLLERYLKALEQANDYILKHPDEAKTVLKNRFNYTDEYLESVWPENNFSLSLDLALIAAMEDEARWMISNNLTAETEVPNFLDYIYEDALKEVKPEAVRIIR